VKDVNLLSDERQDRFHGRSIDHAAPRSLVSRTDR
jgi:hypothetical protein